MKKEFKYYLAAWALALAMFVLAIFLVPSSIDGKTIIQLVSLISVKDAYILSLSGISESVFNKYDASFWPSFALIIASFLINLYCAYYALKEDNKQKLFYNIPLIKVSYIGLILNLLFGIVCMFFPNCPIWVGIIVSTIVIFFTIISIICAQALSDNVSKKDEIIKNSTSNMKRLAALAETNYRNENDPIKKEELRKIYEALKYSDSVSNEETKEIEDEILSNLDNSILVLELINKRNTICKNNK